MYPIGFIAALIVALWELHHNLVRPLFKVHLRLSKSCRYLYGIESGWMVWIYKVYRYIPLQIKYTTYISMTAILRHRYIIQTGGDKREIKKFNIDKILGTNWVQKNLQMQGNYRDTMQVKYYLQMVRKSGEIQSKIIYGNRGRQSGNTHKTHIIRHRGKN